MQMVIHHQKEKNSLVKRFPVMTYSFGKKINTLPTSALYSADIAVNGSDTQ